MPNDYSDFEQVADDYSDFEAVADKAPQQAAPQPQSESSRWKTLLDGVRGIGAGTMLGMDDEAAAMVGAGIDKMFFDKDKPLAEIYKDNQQYMRKDKDAARERSPVASLTGNVIGSAPLAAMTAGFNPIVTGASLGYLQGIGDSTAETGDTVGMLEDGVKGAALGGALAYGVPKVLGALKEPAKKLAAAPIQYVKETLGDAMQLPQKAVDAVAGRLGKTQLAQKYAATSDIAETASSAKVKALKNLVQEAELGKSMSSAINAEVKASQGFADKLLDQLSDAERGKVAESLSRLMEQRGIKQPPEFFLGMLDELPEMASVKGEATVGKLLRSANKSSIKNAIFRLQNAGRMFGGVVDGIDQSVTSHIDDNAALAEKMRSNVMDQFGRPTKEAGRGMMGLSEIDAELNATKNIRRPVAPTIEPIDPAIAQAKQDLANIATGRQAMQQGGAMLSGVGGAVGALTGGAYGAAGGAVLGGQLKQVPKAADFLGDIGQSMSGDAKSKLDLALKMFQNENLLARAARDPGALGNAARWVMDGAKDKGSLAARSFVLALNPEFRDMLANDENTTAEIAPQ
jgi:hypothetical protein